MKTATRASYDVGGSAAEMTLRVAQGSHHRFLPRSELNKVLARRFLEAQARSDMETLDELMAEDFVDRSPLRPQKPGREDYRLDVKKDTPFC